MRLGNLESYRWTGYRCFIFASIQIPQQLRPLTMSFLKKHVFRPLGEFAISLILVISCEPVNAETESRNFSALEACLQMADSSLFQFSCLCA